MTLTELVVAVAVLGVAAGVVTLSLSAGAAGGRADGTQVALRRARADAVRRGESVTITLAVGADTSSRCESPSGRSAPRVVFATAYPDGSVVADTAVTLEGACGGAP